MLHTAAATWGWEIFIDHEHLRAPCTLACLIKTTQQSTMYSPQRRTVSVTGFWSLCIHPKRHWVLGNTKYTLSIITWTWLIRSPPWNTREQGSPCCTHSQGAGSYRLPPAGGQRVFFSGCQYHTLCKLISSMTLGNKWLHWQWDKNMIHK